MGIFLNYLSGLDENAASEFIDTILPFATKESCYDRQTYVYYYEY